MERHRGRFVKNSGAGDDAGEDRSSGELGSGENIGAGHTDQVDLADAARLNGHADTPASLEAEAIAAVNGAPVDTPAALDPSPVGPSMEEIRAGYVMLCNQVIDSGANAIMPAWQVTPREVSKLSNACATALLLWFPDQIIPPKYLALLTICGVGFEIAQARRDPNTGRYRPARLPDPTPQQGQAAPNAPAPAH